MFSLLIVLEQHLENILKDIVDVKCCVSKVLEYNIGVISIRC